MQIFSHNYFTREISYLRYSVNCVGLLLNDCGNVCDGW